MRRGRGRRFRQSAAGEYLLVATDDVAQEWLDPALLEPVRETGVRITLPEGEQKVQPLKAS